MDEKTTTKHANNNENHAFTIKISMNFAFMVVYHHNSPTAVYGGYNCFTGFSLFFEALNGNLEA